MFIVVKLLPNKGEEPLLDRLGKPLIFDTGEQASTHAQIVTRSSGEKYQPRRIKSDAWTAREQARFNSGEYERVPWNNESWWIGSDPDIKHYAHVSQSNRTLLAYTKDDRQGCADVRTRIQPGRYLKTFFGEVLDDEAIRHWANQWGIMAGDAVLKFAKTPEDIERVYTNGPDSCMSHPPSEYGSFCHPVHAYGDSDLQLAYMQREDDIIARALVWPEKKRYGRVYGDYDRMYAALHEAGYEEGDFIGAKIRQIWDEEENSIVAPYLDYNQLVEPEGTEFLVISNEGTLRCDVTDGLISLIGCECCETRFRRIDATRLYYSVTDDNTYDQVCPNCREEAGFYDVYSGRYFVPDVPHVLMHDGSFGVETTFAELGFTCAASGANYPQRHYWAVDMYDGTTWGREHFRLNGFHDSQTGENYPNSMLDPSSPSWNPRALLNNSTERVLEDAA